MTKLAAEIPLGVAPARARLAALHAAHVLERDFNGRRDEAGDMMAVNLRGGGRHSAAGSM
jgi:hypothetical protein